jgi:broad specificity phosphatase PhoE
VSHGQSQPASSNGEAPGLSEVGLRQARAIAREIAAGAHGSWRPEAVFTSAWPAAAETAREIAAALDAAEPVAAAELADGAPDSRSDPSQDITRAEERAWVMIESLKERYEKDATIVLVSNQEAVRSLVRRALNMPPADMRRFDLEPASITTIEFRGQRTLIGALNEVCHLER